MGSILSANASSGDNKIEVFSMKGFEIGRQITINLHCHNTEIKRISALVGNTLFLDTPLKLGHSKTEAVEQNSDLAAVGTNAGKGIKDVTETVGPLQMSIIIVGSGAA